MDERRQGENTDGNKETRAMEGRILKKKKRRKKKMNKRSKKNYK